ncbi:unnamed protein product [Rotaria magnacalcarata]|uniref:Uncharacterized protein n=1 Tax=Rotaria magnacalcarata TaxID=392030 RepID=A0A816N8H4_9BILA|nr:unnamed protein product [Rotaria magnacalcarata]CAF2033134.1 unnamed protein product [Rotaria magnacalcarata]CAF3821993.1 unnamed protein product [Rotaria magnacalcarata]CAF3833485.1 unnamed protein product [Rotaria magnacalcarata]
MIILDILIPNFPTDDERLSLVLLNSKASILIMSTGHICLNTTEGTVKSEAMLKLNQFIRLLISVDKTLIKIYADGLLILDVNVDNASLALNSNGFHLFRNIDLDDNITNNDTLRIECKSITFLNRSIETVDFDEILKSSKYSLETFIALPDLINVSSLINIGYKTEWIKYVMKQYKTTNIQLIDTVIREYQEEMSKIDIEMQENRNLNIFLRLGSSIDKTKLENLINASTMDTEDRYATIYELMLTHWNDLQTLESATVKRKIENEKSIHSVTDEVELNSCFNAWIRDKSTATIMNANNYQVFDLNKSEEEQTLATIGIFHQRKKFRTLTQYSPKDISYQQYIDSLIACEYRLISVYARDTILNTWIIWSKNNVNRSPLEKFGDYPSIVKLLRSMNDHYTYISIDFDDRLDPLIFLIKSILKNEVKALMDDMGSNYETLQNKASLLYHLQKDIIIESIQFILRILLSIDGSDDKIMIIEELAKNEEMNLNFTLKILSLFVGLINDRLTVKEHEIDTLISYLFSEPLINVMFDLFLILPTHQSKIFILHIFITLMQSSVKFRLNQRIQNFMSQLLIELLSTGAVKPSRMIKTLQIMVMDFVYLDLSRQISEFNISNSINQQFKLKLSNLPQDFQDLWMVIDIINAITDQTKQTLYPDLLFIKARTMLNKTPVFTLDDITVSSNYFDNIADLQLINLMNNNALIEHSFSEFIHNVAVAYASNSISFELYPSLLNIPVNCVQNRAKLFHILGVFAEKVLPLFDFTFAPGKSLLADKFRIVKKNIY